MNAFVKALNATALLHMPSVYDGLTARLCETLGFPGIALGGYDQGMALGPTEPLLTQTEVVVAVQYIRRVCSLPLLVDVGAGFGEPMHVVRLVRDLAAAGADAIQIEDQVYPKRAHYFGDYREHIISIEEMLQKIRWAKSAGGERVAVVARTDAFKTHGEAEALARCRAYLAAGADAAMAFPNTMAEAERLPGSIPGPLVYVNTHGNRIGRPPLTPAQATALGYQALLDAHVLLFAAFDGMRSAVERFHAQGGWVFERDVIDTRRQVENLMGVPELLKIEADTVEKD